VAARIAIGPAAAKVDWRAAELYLGRSSFFGLRLWFFPATSVISRSANIWRSENVLVLLMKCRRGRGPIMADVDELRFLLDELAEAAEKGSGAHLSPHMARLLMSVIEAQRGFVDADAETASHRFRIVMGDDGEGPATALGAASDIEVARAILAWAIKRNARRKIRLYDGSAIIEEAN
jgi:hypothetical protein